MVTLGIDVGSSGCKVAAFDQSGTQLKRAYRPYPLQTPRPGWRQLDPEEVWAAVWQALGEVCAGGVGGAVSAVAVSAQGEAIIPIDQTGRALTQAQVSFDSRSRGHCDRVFAQLDGARLHAITGTPKHSMFSLYKLLWLQEWEPGVLAGAWRIASFADWVAFRLCGELVMDHSQASRTAMFDVVEGGWSDWLVSTCGVDTRLLPAVAPSGTPIGTVRPALADQLGLRRGVVVGTGGHDQICAALGAGVQQSEAMNSMGTTDSIVCLTPSFQGAGELAAAGLACGSSALPGLYAMHAFVLSTGSIAAWFQKTCRTDGATLNEMAERAWALNRPSGLLFLPHLSGSGTPHLDEKSAGILSGLTLETTPTEVYRAILESICFELAENIQHMKAAGAEIRVIKAIGGAAASDPYLQIKADIYGIPVARPRVIEAGCLGASLLARHAAGGLPSLEDAFTGVASIEAWFEPDQERHQEYADLAVRHSQLYAISSALRANNPE